MKYLTAIWGMSVMAALVGCIPYGIWVARSAVKKRWKMVGILLGVPAVFLALLVGATVIADSHAADRRFSDLYDTDAELPAPIFEHDPGRSFNGDGYSISIHELPAGIRRRFENPDSRLLNEFPKRPHYRDHWSVVTWKEAPFDGSQKKYLDFAMAGAGVHAAGIRDALARKGTFYAFFHYDHGSSPGNIDFYVVDLAGRRLYLINVNT